MGWVVNVTLRPPYPTECKRLGGKLYLITTEMYMNYVFVL